MSLLILGKGVIDVTVITMSEVVAIVLTGTLLMSAGFSLGRLSK